MLSAHWVAVLLSLCMVLGWSGAARAERAGSRGPRLIVKLASEGAHAVESCAEDVFEHDRRFEQVTRDRSDSLDRLHARHGVRRIRALFRRADGRPLAEQRAALRDRLGRRPASVRARRSRAAPAALAEADVPDLSHVYIVQAGADASVERLLEDYAADPHVAWVQRDHLNSVDALPNDPYFASSGAWGQDYLDLWGLHLIRAPEAWAITRGEGVVVAVVDTGIDYDHPDIADNVWVNPGEDLDGDGRAEPEEWNGVDDDDNGFIDDFHGFDFANSLDADGDGRFDGPNDVNDSDPWDDRGHGTHVAGTIAAVPNNGIGIVGVAPDAKVMAVKGFAESGPGRDSDLWRGVMYAAANGATVINNSWSCSIPCPNNPLAEEVIGLLSSQGVVIVTSAGNRLSDVIHNSPENKREVITVASSGEDDRPSETFTNFGWSVDLAAPGGGPHTSTPRLSRRNILSLRSSGINEIEDQFRVGEEYMRWAGTSMAAPHVAGVVALLQSARPDLDYEAIRRVLRESAVDTGPPGFDNQMGAGRLDALAALEHGDPAQLRAAITAPAIRAIVSPEAGSIEVRGSATGGAFVEYDLSWGRGIAPPDWTPIVAGRRDAVDAGVLAIWEIAELPPGAYVLRLEVHGTGGEVYEEFVQLSLERNGVVQLSSFGPPAVLPSVSGDRVVWQSERDPASETGEADDSNLFATQLSSGEERALQLAPGDQREARVSGNVVTWLDGRPDDPGEMDVYACRLGTDAEACDPVLVAQGARNPGVVAGHVMWEAEHDAGFDLASCRIHPGSNVCEPVDLGLEAGSRFLIGFGEHDIAWFDHTLGGRIAACAVDPLTGACPARALAEPIALAGPVVVDGSLVAYTTFEFTTSSLFLCELDPETGECPPMRVRANVSDVTPRLSGNRLVWHAAPRGQATDVFFCEYDPLRRRCPVQRVTSEMSDQVEADVSGDWIVWQDHRLGASQIFGLQLPELRPLRDRRVREGRRLFIPVRASHGGGAELRLGLEVEVVGEGQGDAEALGMQLIDAGGGRGALVWRPGFDRAGEYVVTFEASAEGGLTTRQSIRLEVVEANARPRIVLEAPGSVAIGQSAVLDACDSFDPDGDVLDFRWDALPASRYGRARSHRGAELIGTDCRLEIPPSDRIALRRYRVRVSDGVAESSRTVTLLWLPERWLRWWTALQ
jgi:subtilisin family serine protease